MAEQIKAHTMGTRREPAAMDSHARYHDGDWLTVAAEADQVVPGHLVCTCSCGNVVYVHEPHVYRRRKVREQARDVGAANV